MGVRIDQSGQHRGVGEINHFGVSRHFRASSIRNASNPVSADYDHLIVTRSARFAINQSAGADHGDLGSRRAGGLLTGCGQRESHAKYQHPLEDVHQTLLRCGMSAGNSTPWIQ